MTRSNPITLALVAIIAVVFAFEWMAGGTKNPAVLVSMGAIIPNTLGSGQLWRLVAAMFLHIGILHLAINLWALYQLGGVFEVLFGSRRFALTYFAAGIVASISSALFTNGIAAGASGAIFGILGALIIAIRRTPRFRNAPWSRGLVQQLILWAGINIVIGFTMPGIDNAAHIGGFLTGLALGLIPHKVPPPPPRDVVVEAWATDRPPEDRSTYGG